jgi:hypothetical protein
MDYRRYREAGKRMTLVAQVAGYLRGQASGRPPGWPNPSHAPQPDDDLVV